MSTAEGSRPEDVTETTPNVLQRNLQNFQRAFEGAVTKLNLLRKGQWKHGFLPHTVNEELKAELESPPAKSYKDIRDEGLAAWRQNSSWTEASPHLEVSVPKGAFCQLKSEFTVGIPPDALFDILIDPENKRVFKDIQGVNFRDVIEDDGDRQLVELEQAAIWRFLWMSGTLNVRLFVDQDRRSHTVKYRLSKEGFMKRFEGSWKIDPILVDVGESSATSDSIFKDREAPIGRVASLVKLHQELQPAIQPPPPISWYVRGITAKTTENLLIDLQAEAKRLREGTVVEDAAGTQLLKAIDKELEQSPLLHKQFKPSLNKSPGVTRRRARRNHLRDK